MARGFLSGSLACVFALAACGGSTASTGDSSVPDAGIDAGAVQPDAMPPFPLHEPRLVYVNQWKVSLVTWSNGQPNAPVVLDDHSSDSPFVKWSPDGTRLLVRAAGRGELIDVSGDVPVTSPILPAHAEDSIAWLGWAPNARRFGVVSQSAAGSMLSFVDLMPDGSLSTPRSLDLEVGENVDAYVSSIVWSPDSRRLLYVVASNHNPSALWVADTAQVGVPAPRLIGARIAGDLKEPHAVARWCTGSDRVFYLGLDGAITGPSQLWSVALSDGALGAPIRVNSPLAADSLGVTGDWGLASDCRALVYFDGRSIFLVDTHAAHPGQPKAIGENLDSTTWSPDSRWLTVQSSPPGQPSKRTAIYDLASETPASPTPLGEAATDGVVWRGDSRQFVFSTYDATAHTFVVDVTAAGMGAPRELLPSPGLTGIPIALSDGWSSDGALFAYRSDGHEAVADLSAMPTASRDLGPYLAYESLNFASHTTWSPGGRWLAFVADRGVNADESLEAVDLSMPGSAPIELDSASTIDGWNWAP